MLRDGLCAVYVSKEHRKDFVLHIYAVLSQVGRKTIRFGSFFCTDFTIKLRFDVLTTK